MDSMTSSLRLKERRNVTAMSSRFNVGAVTRNLETLFERMYRRYRAGLPPDHLTVEHGAPAPRAASSAELCS
jgi:hypothetical protein